MKPDQLKKIRKEMGARQKDLAKILGVPVRTYQNWEQMEGSREHRRIPDEYVDRVLSIAELRNDHNGAATEYPIDLIWLQIPLRKNELQGLKRQAIIDDKSLILLARECILSAF